MQHQSLTDPHVFGDAEPVTPAYDNDIIYIEIATELADGRIVTRHVPLADLLFFDE